MRNTLAAAVMCLYAAHALGADPDRVTLQTARSTVVLDPARRGAVVSLMLGTMIRPPTLIAPSPPADEPSRFPPIMLNAFRALDGSEAVIIANATGLAQTVHVIWQQRPLTLQLAPWTLRLIR
jgi:hypothetical protein